MLAGLALENLAKGVVVGDEPSRVGVDRLRDWGAQGHDLVWLFEKAHVVLTDAETELVLQLNSMVEWSGRYPVPMRWKDYEGTGAMKQTDFETFDGLFSRISGPDWAATRAR